MSSLRVLASLVLLLLRFPCLEIFKSIFRLESFKVAGFSIESMTEPEDGKGKCGARKATAARCNCTTTIHGLNAHGDAEEW